jgi:hypothetical protein
MSVDVGLVFEKHIPYLFHLIRLRLIPDRLQVENLFHARFVEDGVTAFSLFLGESSVFKEVAEIGEGDVRVGPSRENVGKCFAGFAHGEED